MKNFLLFVTMVIAGQMTVTSAVPTIVCNANKTITITVLPTDTDYVNKTIRLVDGTCVGTAGPVSASGGSYVIPSCTGVNTINWDTEYTFIFQDDTNYLTSTDKVLSLTCVPDVADQSVNVTLGATLPTTDASVTGTIKPTLAIDISASGSSVTTAVVGNSLNLSLSLGSDYTSDFKMIVKQITLISGTNTLTVLDPATFCVNTDGANIGFMNPSDGGGRTTIDINFSAFILTLDAASAVSTTGGGGRTTIDINFSAFILTLDAASAVSTTGNQVVFSVQVGVCFTGSSACNPSNCTDGTTSYGRKRREDTNDYVVEQEFMRQLVVFTSEQAQSEFLASIEDQLGMETTQTKSDDVCVDRNISIAVVTVLVVLIVLSMLSVIYMMFRTRRSNKSSP